MSKLIIHNKTGDDCENGCFSEALTIINKERNYSGEYEKAKESKE